MRPDEQKTIDVVKKIYALLLETKSRKSVVYYMECFERGFGMPYNNDEFYSQWIMGGKVANKVANNIPQILGAIGHICVNLGMPPLCCLVVGKSNGMCGNSVITSVNMPKKDRADFAERVDRPNTYSYNDYPSAGTNEYDDFLAQVINHLRQKIQVVE